MQMGGLEPGAKWNLVELGAGMCYQRDSKCYSYVFWAAQLNGDEVSHVRRIISGRNPHGGLETGTTWNLMQGCVINTIPIAIPMFSGTPDSMAMKTAMSDI
jgi:hypothetical protein